MQSVVNVLMLVLLCSVIMLLLRTQLCLGARYWTTQLVALTVLLTTVDITTAEAAAQEGHIRREQFVSGHVRCHVSVYVIGYIIITTQQ
jgi:hypothetical protein